MRTLKLVLAYDGGAYAGWQFQPNHPTIQAALEQAIAKITGEELRVAASGRTDAGVHALGQVVSLSTASPLPADVFQRALNATLPRDIVVLSAAEVAPGFHACRDALRKRYRYVIHDGPLPDVFRRGYAWHVRQRLDVAAMRQAAEALLGRHDFSSFETSGSARTTSVRLVCDISADREQGAPDFIGVEIEADGFLYNMVRTIAGSLVEIGRGTRPESWLKEVLMAADRRFAGPTAPPHGLFLLEVKYAGDISSEGQGRGEQGRAGKGRETTTEARRHGEREGWKSKPTDPFPSQTVEGDAEGDKT